MLLILDIDVLCYAAIPNRPDPKSSAIVSLEDASTVDTNPYSTAGYTDEENEEWLESCWNNLLGKIEEIKEAVYATDCVCYVKGDTNFRDEI